MNKIENCYSYENALCSSGYGDSQNWATDNDAIFMDDPFSGLAICQSPYDMDVVGFPSPMRDEELFGDVDYHLATPSFQPFQSTPMVCDAPAPIPQSFPQASYSVPMKIEQPPAPQFSPEPTFWPLPTEKAVFATIPPPSFLPAPVPVALPPCPAFVPQVKFEQPSFSGFKFEAMAPPKMAPLLPQLNDWHSPMPIVPEEKVLFSQLNTHDFDYFYPHAAPSFRTTPRLGFDISCTFSAVKYTEIFNQFGSHLLLEKHPQLNEDDFKQIEKTGYLYFIKNVKTIVPTIGPWKFLSHVRTGNGTSDRSYNLVGFPIRCKVKEWLVGNDLWRCYHFVKGKTPKQRAH
jgi:hypothetical protein